MRNHLVPKFKTQQERIAFWYPICKAKLTSKLTGAAFCSKYNVSRTPLQKWSKYFEQYQSISQSPSKVNSTTAITTKTTNNKQKKTNSAFLPVAVTEIKPTILAKQSNNYTAINQTDTPPMELHFPNGIKLIFKREVNINLLMQLITAGRC
jgi:hypothetical protein